MIFDSLKCLILRLESKIGPFLSEILSLENSGSLHPEFNFDISERVRGGYREGNKENVEKLWTW